jgi:nucleoside-diphosphate-sugar epimerase
MAPQRVLILGITGGCGEHALSQLLDRGVQCVAVVPSEDCLPAACRGKRSHADGILVAEVVPEGHLALNNGAFSALVEGVDAVVSVIGAQSALKLCGQPRRLAADTVERIVAAAAGRATPLKLIIASTDRVDQPGGKDPPRGCAERALLAVTVGRRDHMAVVDELAKAGSHVEFCAVRPAALLAGGERPYECHAALQSGAFCGGAKTRRANVAAFVADLVSEDEVWAKWKNAYPHCVDVVTEDPDGVGDY